MEITVAGDVTNAEKAFRVARKIATQSGLPIESVGAVQVYRTPYVPEYMPHEDMRKDHFCLVYRVVLNIPGVEGVTTHVTLEILFTAEQFGVSMGPKKNPQDFQFRTLQLVGGGKGKILDLRTCWDAQYKTIAFVVIREWLRTISYSLVDATNYLNKIVEGISSLP